MCHNNKVKQYKTHIYTEFSHPFMGRFFTILFMR